MSSISYPNTFVVNTPADPTQVNANFNAVTNVVNGSIDDSNVASGANIQASKIQGTAVTQNYLNTFGLANIIWNPFFFGSGTTIPGWTLNANTTITFNDTNVTTGENSISDANASDSWVIAQTILTSLKPHATGTADVNLVPGQTYVVSANVKTTSGGNTVFIAVQNASSYAGGNTNIQSTTTYATGGGSYQRIYSVFTVPASCNNITVALVKAATTTNVTVCDFNMTLGSVPDIPVANVHQLPSGYYLLDYPNDGWIPSAEAWTWSSTNTMTTPGDFTWKYSKGDRFRCKQGGSYEYFFINTVSVASNTTTVVLAAGSDYTLTNATITDAYFSKSVSPNGFPQWFNYSPTITAGGSMTISGPGTTLAIFTFAGSTVYYAVKLTFTLGGTAANNVNFTTPTSIASGWASNFQSVGGGTVGDNGTTITGSTLIQTSTVIGTYRYDNANWTLGSGRSLNISGFYQSA